MSSFRVVAIPTEAAEKVRTSSRSPFHDFPTHTEVIGDDAPCRHCLRLIAGRKEEAILCTYDRFSCVESLPQPGPIYLHARECQRFPEDGSFPDELRSSPRTLEAYSSGRNLLGREHVTDGRYESVIDRLFANPAAKYIQVNSTTAGCFTFRIERK